MASSAGQFVRATSFHCFFLALILSSHEKPAILANQPPILLPSISNDCFVITLNTKNAQYQLVVVPRTNIERNKINK
jgi:hypothetical protein